MVRGRHEMTTPTVGTSTRSTPAVPSSTANSAPLRRARPEQPAFRSCTAKRARRPRRALPTPIRAVLPAIAVLACCAACSSAGSRDAAAHPFHPDTPSRTTPISRVSPTATTAPRTRNGFCTLARKTGIADIEVTGGSAHTDTTTLLRGIDRLDAGAPAEIKSDFHAFDELEHTILDPSGGKPTLPGSNLAAAMAHVSRYLSDTCGLG